jgi:hypothetical protein
VGVPSDEDQVVEEQTRKKSKKPTTPWTQREAKEFHDDHEEATPEVEEKRTENEAQV